MPERFIAFIQVRVTKSTHRDLFKVAKLLDQDLSKMIRDILTEYVEVNLPRLLAEKQSKSKKGTV